MRSDPRVACAEIMEFALKRNAGLGYSAEPTVAQMAAAAKVSVSQVRMLLAALAALSQVYCRHYPS